MENKKLEGLSLYRLYVEVGLAAVRRLLVEHVAAVAEGGVVAPVLPAPCLAAQVEAENIFGRSFHYTLISSFPIFSNKTSCYIIFYF